MGIHKQLVSKKVWDNEVFPMLKSMFEAGWEFTTWDEEKPHCFSNTRYLWTFRLRHKYLGEMHYCFVTNATYHVFRDMVSILNHCYNWNQLFDKDVYLIGNDDDFLTN